MSKRDTAGKPPHQSSSWCQSVHQIYVLIKTVQPLLSQRSVESEVKANGRSVCLCSPLGTIVLSQGPDHLSFKCHSSLETKAKLPLSPDIRQPRGLETKTPKSRVTRRSASGNTQRLRNEASFRNGTCFGQLKNNKTLYKPFCTEPSANIHCKRESDTWTQTKQRPQL